jgi:hypothetical protein
MNTNYQHLADELTVLADAAGSAEDLMSVFVGRLQERLRHFDSRRGRRAKVRSWCWVPTSAQTRHTSAFP